MTVAESYAARDAVTCEYIIVYLLDDADVAEFIVEHYECPEPDLDQELFRIEIGKYVLSQRAPWMSHAAFFDEALHAFLNGLSSTKDIMTWLRNDTVVRAHSALMSCVYKWLDLDWYPEDIEE